MSSNTPTLDLSRIISEHLSKWLQSNKNVVVSAEEIAESLNLPYEAGIPSGVTMPDYLTSSKAPAKKSRKKNTDPNAPKCTYVFQRGRNKDQECGKTVANDPNKAGSNRYCNTCLRKKTVQAEVESGGYQTVSPPNIDSNAPVAEASSNSGSSTLKAMPYGNGYLELDNSFYLEPYQDTYVVQHVLVDKETGKTRPLTDEEKAIASQLGLCVLDETEAENETSLSSTQPSTLQQVPQPSTLQQVPQQQVPQQQAPQQQVPQVQIPSIPNML